MLAMLRTTLAISAFFTLLTASLAHGGGHGHEDIGYDLMFEDSLNETAWDCWDVPQLPSWVNGSFIVPTVAQFSFGGREFKGALDGFGKMHRFQMSEGKLCLKAKIMRTGFYNQSMVRTIPPSFLFVFFVATNP